MNDLATNHAVLVARARRWLTFVKGCCPVLTEFSSGAREIPDAIGWNAGNSVLVECKTSRGDFLADQKKLWRGNTNLGLGRERYYMTPPDLLRFNDIPAGWGLLEYNGAKVRRVHECTVRHLPDGSYHQELRLLCSALRRVHVRIAPMSFKDFFMADRQDCLEPMYVVRRLGGEPLFPLAPSFEPDDCPHGLEIPSVQPMEE